MKQPINPSVKFFGLVSIAVIAIGIALLTSAHSPIQNTEFKIPHIIINKKNASHYLNSKYVINAQYDVEFITPFCNLLDLSSKEKNVMLNDNLFDFSEMNKQYEYSNKNLIVIVDTTMELTIANRSKDLQNDALEKDVKSYPIYISNLSDKKNAILETENGSALMILEAQDKQKHWKAIEFLSNNRNENSYAFLVIPPKHFAFIRGIKYNGNFETTCRLKLINEQDSIYSNEFKMSVNRSQFEVPTIQ